MAIFNEYLTGEDRVLAVEAARYENEWNKLSTLFEMTSMQLDQMRNDAEMKVFEESGTYDDLDFLYQEAENETTAQNQNIFQKIIQWFKNIFTAIGNKVKSFLGNKNPEEEVEVPVEVIEKVGAIEKAHSEMSVGFAKIRNGDFTGAFNILNAVKIPALVAAGAIGTGVAIKKMKKGEADGLMQRLNKIKENVEAMFNGISSKLLGLKDANQQRSAKSSLNPIQKFMSLINNVTSAICSAMKKGAAVVKDKVDEVTGKKENAKKEKQIANDKFAGQKNGVTIKRFGQFEYRIDQTKGTVTKVDKKGNETDVPTGEIPPQLLKLVHRAKAEGAMQTQNQQNQADKIREDQKSLKGAKKTFNVSKGGKVIVNPKTHRFYYVDKSTGKSTELNKNNLAQYVPGDTSKERNLRKKIVAAVTESAEIDIKEMEAMFTEAGYEFVAEEDSMAEICTDLENNGWIIESADGIITAMETVEAEVDDVSANIFGEDLSGEVATESAKDAFDQEVEDLMLEFADL